jgi:hypothetical protein
MICSWVAVTEADSWGLSLARSSGSSGIATSPSRASPSRSRRNNCRRQRRTRLYTELSFAATVVRQNRQPGGGLFFGRQASTRPRGCAEIARCFPTAACFGAGGLPGRDGRVTPIQASWLLVLNDPIARPRSVEPSQMWKTVSSIIVAGILVSPPNALRAAEGDDLMTRKSVVKILATIHQPDPYRPWT